MTADDHSRLRRSELAAFLRARRARLRPSDVGLPDVGRRRTPGLRRQEVAQLAGISVEYYVRLEQARGAHPSRQVLSAVARALVLTRDERDYLYRLAGEAPPRVSGPSREVPPGVRHLIDTLSDAPVYVVDAAYHVLAWNRSATHFVGNLAEIPPDDRNMIRWIFRRPPDDVHWADQDTLRFTRSTVADLRVAYARYLGDPGIQALVTELLALSPRFAAMWADHDVEERRNYRKRIDHPEFGRLEFECQLLLVPDVDQRVILYCAEPDSPTAAVFRELGRRPAAAPVRPAEVRPADPAR